MQPIKELAQALANLADAEHYLFALRDLSAVVPGQSPTALKAIVGRAVKSGLLLRKVGEFLELTKERNRQLHEDPATRMGFIQEMRRFLPPEVVAGTVEKEEFWVYLTNLLRTESARVIQALTSAGDPDGFEM